MEKNTLDFLPGDMYNNLVTNFINFHLQYVIDDNHGKPFLQEKILVFSLKENRFKIITHEIYNLDRSQRSWGKYKWDVMDL